MHYAFECNRVSIENVLSFKMKKKKKRKMNATRDKMCLSKSDVYFNGKKSDRAIIIYTYINIHIYIYIYKYTHIYFYLQITEIRLDF